MRILYFAKDAPFVNSGYGKCCREICQRLNKLGHQVAVFATVGNRSSFLFEWGGLTIYPGVEDVFGEDVILDHYHDWKADLLITQIDLWPLRAIHELAKAGEINWMPYAPLDSDPVPEAILGKLRSAVHVVAMAQYGKDAMDKAGIESSVIHHGIDTNVYRILEDKKKIKQELGFPPDCYLIGMIQANQFLRKALEEQFRGVKIFKDKHPQIDVRLYCHTTPSRADSYNLIDLANWVGINKYLSFPNLYEYLKGFSEERLARVYNAFDVLLSATNGEGFGLPVIEAQACGIPVIGTDCMTFPELVKYGSLVKVKSWMTLPAGLRKAMPDENDIAEKLWLTYLTEWNAREISDTAHYLWNWDSKIIQEWMWVLQIVKDKFEKKCMKIPKPSKLAMRLSKEEV